MGMVTKEAAQPSIRLGGGVAFNADAQAKLVRDRIIEIQGQIFSQAAAYDNAVIIAGYAAFFALWAGVNDDVSRNCRLVTVGLMGASLLLFITWHVLQMLVRQKFEHQRIALFAISQDAARFNAEWAQMDQDQAMAQQRLMVFWLPIFVPSLGLGIIGGLTLAYNALATLFDWWRII